MTAISSFRPLDDSPTIAQHQLRAKASWERVFDCVTYFNPPEPRLASARTVFIDSEDFPHMSKLFLAAAMTDDIVAILNADIVTAPALRPIMEQHFARGVAGMMSFRQEYDPETCNYAQATQVDAGLDFFAAYPDVWQMAYKNVSTEYRHGHGKWDCWLMNFMQVTLGQFFADITQYRCIFHPRHGERRQLYYISPIDDMFCIGGRRSL